jgi:hypothetical protein
MNRNQGAQAKAGNRSGVGKAEMNFEKRIEQQLSLIKHEVQELIDRLDRCEELTQHRELLADALIQITEAFRAAAGSVPAVVAAERVMETLVADGFYDEITPELEKRQIDRWIDEVGTAPPGVSIDHLK